MTQPVLPGSRRRFLCGVAAVGAAFVTIGRAHAKPTGPVDGALVEIGGSGAVWVEQADTSDEKSGAFRVSYPIAAGGLLEWVRAAARGRFEPISGAVTIVEDGIARRRVDFTEAYINEIKLPSLSTSKKNKQPFTVDIKWQPTQVKHSKASGKIAAKRAEGPGWDTSSFRVEGLGAIADLVTTITLPTITTKLVDKKRVAQIGDLTIELEAASPAALAKVIADGKLTDGEYFDAQIDMRDASTGASKGKIVLERSRLRASEPAADGSAKLTLTFAVERFDLRIDA